MAPPVASKIDPLGDEIAALKEEVASLRQALKVETTTILSSDEFIQRILKPYSSATHALIPRNAEVLRRAELQQAYKQQCLLRLTTSVTTFKVRDPDPRAVDGGHVLGLRFEVMSKGQFLSPYYVMLNRPYPGSAYLRVHRHTLPPAIPLAGLAARHLPAPQPESETPPKQDFDRFVRKLRREIARCHNRLGVAADLRRGLGLHSKNAMELLPNDIVEVGIADIEAKQISLSWTDERGGRVIMDDDGNVQKLVIFGKEGRDWETTNELELYGNYERIEDLAKRLREYSRG